MSVDILFFFLPAGLGVVLVIVLAVTVRLWSKASDLRKDLKQEQARADKEIKAAKAESQAECRAVKNKAQREVAAHMKKKNEYFERAENIRLYFEAHAALNNQILAAAVARGLPPEKWFKKVDDVDLVEFDDAKVGKYVEWRDRCETSATLETIRQRMDAAVAKRLEVLEKAFVANYLIGYHAVVAEAFEDAPNMAKYGDAIMAALPVIRDPAQKGALWALMGTHLSR